MLRAVPKTSSAKRRVCSAALALAAAGLMLTLQVARAAGTDHAADDPEPPPGAAATLAESTVRVRIEGVNSLADYATVTRLLQAIPGVRQVVVVQVAGASATFEASVRGGAAALEQLLAGQARFAHSGTDAVYRLQPQAPAP